MAMAWEAAKMTSSLLLAQSRAWGVRLQPTLVYKLVKLDVTITSINLISKENCKPEFNLQNATEN